MDSSQLKAYIVREDYEGHCAIAFAATGVVARRNGANELNIEFEEVESCRRAPEFDRFAPGPVPIIELLAAGWWYECSHCFKQFDSECIDHDDDHPSDPCLDEAGHVYCTPECRARDQFEKRANQAAKAAMAELIYTRWPSATLQHVHVFGDQLRKRKPNDAGIALADFRLPGLANGVRLHFGEDHVYVFPSDADEFVRLYGKREPATRPADQEGRSDG